MSNFDVRKLAEEALELAGKASPKPWTTYGSDSISGNMIYDPDWCIANVSSYDHNNALGASRGPAYIDPDSNAAFIVFARNNIEVLAKAFIEAQKHIAELEDRSWINWCSCGHSEPLHRCTKCDCEGFTYAMRLRPGKAGEAKS